MTPKRGYENPKFFHRLSASVVSYRTIRVSCIGEEVFRFDTPCLSTWLEVATSILAAIHSSDLWAPDQRGERRGAGTQEDKDKAPYESEARRELLRGDSLVGPHWTNSSPQPGIL